MMHNLPNRRTSEDLMAAVRQKGLEASFQECVMPIRPGSGHGRPRNLGWAVFHFSDREACERFAAAFHGFKFDCATTKTVSMEVILDFVRHQHDPADGGTVIGGGDGVNSDTVNCESLVDAVNRDAVNGDGDAVTGDAVNSENVGGAWNSDSHRASSEVRNPLAFPKGKSSQDVANEDGARAANAQHYSPTSAALADIREALFEEDSEDGVVLP
jgi:hypothetical protein